MEDSTSLFISSTTAPAAQTAHSTPSRTAPLRDQFNNSVDASNGIPSSPVPSSSATFQATKADDQEDMQSVFCPVLTSGDESGMMDGMRTPPLMQAPLSPPPLYDLARPIAVSIADMPPCLHVCLSPPLINASGLDSSTLDPGSVCES